MLSMILVEAVGMTTQIRNAARLLDETAKGRRAG
jgi:hypothetical protein